MITNTAIHGDFMTNELPDGIFKLIIADPPYYRTKGEFDFIWSSMDEYLKDVEKWAKECKRLLAENGSLFWWGHAKKIAYSQIVLDKYFDLQNVIKWEKTDCQTRKGYDTFNSFPPVTEHCLFYTHDEINYTDCLTAIRDYIRGEIEKKHGKVVLKQVNEVLGTATNGGGVASACLSLDKTHPAMLTREHYDKIKNWCDPFLTKSYDEIEKEFQELKAEYEKTRRYFNNYLRLTDVWKYSQEVSNSGKYDHDTQKTETLSRIIINSTTRPGDLILVPFAGSGTECSAAAQENREFISYDIKKKYVDMTNQRVKPYLNNLKLF